jgi:signal transduction histidine kinase
MAVPLRGREKRSRDEDAATPDFELLWRHVPSLLLVLDPARDFTIVEASDAYLRLARENRERIVGRPFFEVFPETVSGPGATGAASSRAAFERVVETGRGDGFNSAVSSGDGTVRYLMHRLDAMDPHMRRERERDEAVGALERASEDVDTLAESASQALKTSLRAIDSFCRLFEKMRGAALDEGTRRLLARITSQVNRMDTIIEGLLGLSRSGRGQMSRRRVDVTALAKRVAAERTGRSLERAITVSVEEGLEAWADEALLATVLEHLLDNACKFTRDRDEARIEVGAREVSGRTIFHVRDNGVGFDAARAEKLFSPFVRLHPNADYGGHGIGLATVKRIVERHGGDAWAESRPGEGAVFHFTLSGMPR